MFFVLATVTFGSLASVTVRAQDAHYWNTHFGERSILLGGAVIGSVTDLSAAFYNPGAIGVTTKPRLGLGSQILEISKINLDRDRVDGHDLSQFSLIPRPGLVAGQVPFDTNSAFQWTYVLLTRNRFEFDITDHQGTPLRHSDVVLQENLSETWAGVCVSRPIGDRLGIGGTIFGAYRTHSRLGNALVGKLDSNGASSVSHSSEVQYFTARVLAKFGVMYTHGDWTAGLSLTTPSVHIYGGGSVYERITIAGTENDRIAQLKQTELPAYYQSPISIGIGGSHRIDKTRLHFSAEWFAGVPGYDLLDTKPDTIVNSTPVRPDVRENLRSVLNFGFGVEYRQNDVLSWHGSVASDFSALDRNEPSTLAIATWNIVHFSGGIVLSLPQFTLTTGLSYSVGRDGKYFTNRDVDVLDNLVGGPEHGPVSLTWHRLKLVGGIAVVID
ncbi:MAG: hypothetical protein SGJ05_06185 [bacterium]|nr:hypothetical protein [bacterium]